MYDDGAVGGVAKYMRLTNLIYPNGRDVQYGYGTTGAIDDIMSRLAEITDGTGVDVAYEYLGRGAIVEENNVESSTKLTYLDATGNVAGFDRFGRIAAQLWERYGSNPEVLDDYTYTYDRAGNRTSKVNALHSALDEDYVYDALNRLTGWQVNGSTQKVWTLDSLGNNISATNGGTYNAANEQTAIVGSGVTPTYDAAGNMTTLSSGMTAKYDAWNRLVEVSDGEAITQRNEYDGTNRRIQIFTDFDGSTPDKVHDDYHAGQQIVESAVTIDGERAGGYQYLWSPRYIDAPILRDTLTTDGAAIVAAERVLYLADASFNVTGLVKYDSGADQWQMDERYTYDPYGLVTYRNADWTTVGSSANSNTVLYTGRTIDLLTGLHFYRARFYDAALQRFINRDPVQADSNLYCYVLNNPINATDPSGNSPIAIACLAACGATAACLGPGVYYCADAAARGFGSFSACMKIYWDLLPTWEKWVCGAASVGCTACLFRQVVIAVRNNKCASLKLAKEGACNAAAAVGSCMGRNKNCKCGISSQGFAAMAALWAGCSSARAAYQFACFKPTDPGWDGHVRQINQTAHNAANCTACAAMAAAKGR